ncbi:MULTISPECIES: hypothetical protein [Paenibacillus]|uniref:Uncharacterized protein n=1 Tax=Paenibacillus residui TaxID=629724 RepID=A0ABW3D9U0_9BACL|nr:hypothetical protein [Paenibacillus sp. 32O-W]
MSKFTQGHVLSILSSVYFAYNPLAASSFRWAALTSFINPSLPDQKVMTTYDHIYGNIRITQEPS